MSVKKPKISVLIPVHNGADTLAETVASILNQTFADFELLLFDDASTDASPEIINSFADSRIRRFRSDANLGISEARNRLMELAEGEYLAVMDHDDLSAPRRLEKQAAWLDNNPRSCHGRQLGTAVLRPAALSRPFRQNQTGLCQPRLGLVPTGTPRHS